MNFDERCFLVMGATSGIGSAVCHKLSEGGATLFLTGRSMEKLESLRNSLPNSNNRHKLSVVNIDKSSYQQMQKDLSSWVKDNNFEGINGAVYCPGIAPLLPVKSFSWELIQDVMNVNYTGAVMMAQMLARKEFRPSNGGSIVFLSSIRTRRGEKSLSIYGASKSALVASCRCLALELAPYKIRVNCVCPGSVFTEMSLQSNMLAPNHIKEMMEKHPLGLGSPEDVANVTDFLLSDKSKWITGTELVVDGGFLAG